ncbi:MAG: 2-oxo acid dehydrogenase subunit E2 [Pirellulales bacterium]|nr:2-oxo acid dehydrogenase subunit E2 [Pirellulales bacterium]
MSIEFKLPELGEDIDDAEVAGISVSEGDVIEADTNIMELETDKAIADLPCPHAGKITKIHVDEGDTIKVGQILLTIEESSEEKPVKKDSEEKQETDKKLAAEAKQEAAEPEPHRAKKEEPKAEEVTAEKPEPKEKTKQPKKERKSKQSKSQKEMFAAKEKCESDEEDVEAKDTSQEEVAVAAGPATRRLARELNVDLHEIDGSGPQGRITQEDVVAAHDRLSQSAESSVSSQPMLPDFEKHGPIKRERLNKIARTAMKNISTSWRLVPQVTQHDLADITELETSRRRYLAAEGSGGPKVTLTAITVKAVTTILKEFSYLNASLDAEKEELIVKQYYHIGVAVDTEDGLLLPVIRNVDRKSIVELAAELEDVVERARQRKLGLEDMEGGTFTVSNQGGIGGIAFTPLVNFPQVAILGISRSRKELQMVDGRPQERLMLPLSLSYDHRVVNGADAAHFLVQLAAELSDSFQLLIRT